MEAWAQPAARPVDHRTGPGRDERDHVPRRPVRTPGRRGHAAPAGQHLPADAPPRHRRASLHLAARAGRGRRGGLGAQRRGGRARVFAHAVRIHDDHGHAEPAQRLVPGDNLAEFPMLDRFREAGATDYFALQTTFGAAHRLGPADRVLTSWLTDAADGFDAGAAGGDRAADAAAGARREGELDLSDRQQRHRDLSRQGCGPARPQRHDRARRRRDHPGGAVVLRPAGLHQALGHDAARPARSVSCTNISSAW